MKRLGASFVLLLGFSTSVFAHCDAVDGPVANAASKALNTGNVLPVLAYAPASAESEIRQSFELARQVRSLNNEAQKLADQSFMETVIRLHRAGEGAPYTGLKAAGQDYGPVIPAADDAIETGKLEKLLAALQSEIEHTLQQRLAHVQELQKKTPVEPASEEEVKHVRERISAELGFVTLAESIRQAASGKAMEHHPD